MGNMCGKLYKNDSPNDSLEKPLLDDDSLGGGNSVPKQRFDGSRADTAAIQPSVSATKADTAAIQPSVFADDDIFGSMNDTAAILKEEIPQRSVSSVRADTAVIQPSVSPDDYIITADGSRLIVKSGPIDPFIQIDDDIFGLRAIYFNDEKNILKSLYIVRCISSSGSLEYRMLLEKNINKSTKLYDYADFLYGEMSEADFKKSLHRNFPKYHTKLWKILTDGRVSARLYE